jgi:hypothetical protein
MEPWYIRGPRTFGFMLMKIKHLLVAVAANRVGAVFKVNFR